MLLNTVKRNHGYILKMHMLFPRIFFKCLFSKDGAKNMNNFIVNNTITTWKKMKRILQEPISLPLEQSLDSFSAFTDKLAHMEN
jgi:hypothetical protein